MVIEHNHRNMWRCPVCELCNVLGGCDWARLEMGLDWGSDWENSKMHLKADMVHISQMYVSHWEPAGVCKRRWSVNFEESISGENQNRKGRSMWPFKLLGFPKDWNRRSIGAIEISWEYTRVLESTLKAPRIVAQPMQQSQTNSKSCLGIDRYLMEGIHGWCETLPMYMLDSKLDAWIILYHPCLITLIPANNMFLNIQHFASPL